jgi:HEPN superfamily AbiU2-like protein
MARFRYTDDVQSKYVEKMGQKLGDLFCAISAELVWTCTRWVQLKILFGVTPVRVELLNRAAPLFFGILHNTLFADVILGITRLTDPAKSRYGNKRLTIGQLPSLMSNPQLRSKVKGLVETANHSAKFARELRNNRIAHLDFDLSLKGSTQSLAIATRKSIEESLFALSTVLNSVALEYMSPETRYDICSPSPGDALSLLGVLRDGMLFREVISEKRARGEWDWNSDIERRRREPV